MTDLMYLVPYHLINLVISQEVQAPFLMSSILDLVIKQVSGLVSDT